MGVRVLHCRRGTGSGIAARNPNPRFHELKEEKEEEERENCLDSVGDGDAFIAFTATAVSDTKGRTWGGPHTCLLALSLSLWDLLLVSFFVPIFLFFTCIGN